MMDKLKTFIVMITEKCTYEDKQIFFSIAAQNKWIGMIYIKVKINKSPEILNCDSCIERKITVQGWSIK